jgi:dipeptidyl aminopeptidase/acylaminoacyl peptidase
MKHLLLLTFICVVIAAPTFAQTPNNSLAGKWLGALDVGGVKVRLLLKVEKAGDGYAAKFDSVDQDIHDLPVETITLVGNKMSFTAPKFAMSFEGTVNDKNEEITGTFRQGTGSTPFVFKRVVEVPTISRPQDPKKPYPYDEEEVSYRNTADNVKLSGTLTIPRDNNARHPVVLLISGSGTQNRDSLIAGHRPFLVLADHLTKNGIAVLRVDDRGAGGSDLGSLTVTSENFVYDVLAGVEFLKKRNDIDPKKIGLIGHSEGGMIAPMAAAQSPDIAFIVLLAGLGQTGAEVIQTQTRLIQIASGSDTDTVASTLALTKNVNAIVKAQTDGKVLEQEVNAAIAKVIEPMTEAQRKTFAPVASAVKGSMAMYTLPWYRYFVMYDPAPVLKKVQVPILALNGENDLQVAWKENLGGIAAALKAGNNKDVTVKSFPKLNHLFQTSETGLPSEYGKIEETMSPQVLETITEWIRTRVRK